MIETLTTGDGLRLHLQRWPAPGPSHGTVQIVHGLGEHIGRYAALAETLNAAGWHVAGHDLRGHGRSEGPRGAIAGPYTLLADLSSVVDYLRGAGRHILLGHSLGGLIAARFVAEGLMNEAQRWQREVDGLVLSSPALQLRLSWLQRLALRIVRPLAPGLPVNNGLNPRWLSHDPEVARAYKADPLVHTRVTLQMVRTTVDQGPRRARPRRALAHADAADVGRADRCVAPGGSRLFADQAPTSIVTPVCFPDLFHELFNESEPGRGQVIESLTGWLARF